MTDTAPVTVPKYYESKIIPLEHTFHMEPEIASTVDGMRALGWYCVGAISSVESNTVYLVFEREVSGSIGRKLE